MSDTPRRPIVVLLTSNWISMLGVALATTAGFSWLFALPIQLRGHTNNPYIGIVVFILIPIVLVAGLALIAFRDFPCTAAYRAPRASADGGGTAGRHSEVRDLLRR